MKPYILQKVQSMAKDEKASRFVFCGGFQNWIGVMMKPYFMCQIM
jgi:hypothetical protein